MGCWRRTAVSHENPELADSMGGACRSLMPTTGQRVFPDLRGGTLATTESPKYGDSGLGRGGLSGFRGFERSITTWSPTSCGS